MLGKKVGMTQVYTESGGLVPVTVLQVGPCTVLQVKAEGKSPNGTVQRAAVQLGFDATAKKRKKPQQAYLEKHSLGAFRCVREVPFVRPEHILGAEGAEVAIGAQVGAGVFREVGHVDVRGVTKGRGFSGNIRRHHFHSGPKSHGTKNIREPKSTGMHTDPGRVFKGTPMPGHLGAVRRKVRNLEVVRVDEEAHVLLVKGSVPGPRGGYLYIEESLV